MSQTKKKREETQMNKIRNERRIITIDDIEIQMIIRDCYEQIFQQIRKP
jgi:hypothetical protein